MATDEDNVPPKPFWAKKRFLKFVLPAAGMVGAALIGAWATTQGLDSPNQTYEQSQTGNQNMVANQQVIINNAPLPAERAPELQGERGGELQTSLRPKQGSRNQGDSSTAAITPTGKEREAATIQRNADEKKATTVIRDSTCSGSPQSHNQSGGVFALCVENRYDSNAAEDSGDG